MKKTQEFSLDQLSGTGVLWYINRVAFHPHGWRLVLVVDEEGQAESWHIEVDESGPSWFYPDTDQFRFELFRDTIASAEECD